MLSKPTERPTSLDIAWAAGVYEGEGNCDRGTTERANVTQKDRWLLERLRALFGGTIWINERGVSRWYVTGPTARGFLYTIYCFLSPRRRTQIRKALGKDELLKLQFTEEVPAPGSHD